MVFGGAQALIHFYPSLSEQNKKQLFKYSIFTILAISVLILIVLVLVNPFMGWGNYRYLFYAFPIGVSIAFTELFKRQATNIERLEMPTFYEKIIPKVALPAIFGLLIFGYLNEVNGLMAFIGAYIIMFVLNVVYVLKHYRLNSGFNFKSLFREVPRSEYYKYSFYSFLGSFGAFLSFRIDAFMIPEFISFEANGTFNIGVALATSLAIPATGMFAVYGPKVSALIKTGDYVELGKKYVEVAKTLFFIGAILYASIVLGIDSLFKMLPTYDKLIDSIPIIFLLGANVLFNMSTGFNSEIISYSKYYRFNIVSILVLAVLNVVLNLYFLTTTDLGIIGVAYASLISMVSFNCLKLGFIYRKFGVLPFDIAYLKLVFMVSLVFAVFYFLPENPNAILNLFLKSGLCSIVIMLIAYKMKWVYSFNYWVGKLLKPGKQ